MRYFERKRRSIVKEHYVCGTKKSVSGTDAVRVLSSAGAPSKHLKISGKSEQKIDLEQFLKHKDYFTNLDNYIFGDVGYTYLIPFPEEWIGKELSFSLTEITKMTDITFELADGTGLFASTERLLDYEGSLSSSTSSAYSYFRFTAVVSSDLSEISSFWENYTLSVVGLINDFPQPIQNLNDNGMSVSVHSTNLATAYQMFEGNQEYTELEFEGRKAIRYKCGGYTYHTIEGGFKENTQYTISGYYYTALNPQYEGQNTDGGYLYFVRYTDGTMSDVKSILIWNSNAWVKHTLTTAAGKTVESIGMKSSAYKAFVYVDIDTFQINEGTEALPYEPYYRETVEIPASVQLNGESVPLRLAKYKNADYLLIENGRVKYCEYSSEADPTKLLQEQKEGAYPVEYDLTRTDAGQKLLSLCAPRGENTVLEVRGGLSGVPIELTYYSTEEADTVTITVTYVNESGEEIAEAKEHLVRKGSKYLIVAPHIDGYTRVSTEVFGVADKDTAIELIYSK